MWNVKMPTGDPYMSPDIKDAKEIRRQIFEKTGGNTMEFQPMGNVDQGVNDADLERAGEYELEPEEELVVEPEEEDDEAELLEPVPIDVALAQVPNIPQDNVPPRQCSDDPPPKTVCLRLRWSQERLLRE
mmetsp:Transcript_11534/g.25256  ORF Transcript_11534/g.25256 Transcript_11534/m.25256 type:complete len:130 (-) Transcript_11534:12-401(-)